MDWEQALRTRAKAAVAATVDWDLRPEHSGLPCVVLTLVSDPRPQHLKGFNVHRESRVQVDCWAETATAAYDLREALIPVLVDAGTFDGIEFGRGAIEIGLRRAEKTEAGFVHRDSFDLITLHN